jgi:hypothetical protein
MEYSPTGSLGEVLLDQANQALSIASGLHVIPSCLWKHSLASPRFAFVDFAPLPSLPLPDRLRP